MLIAARVGRWIGGVVSVVVPLAASGTPLPLLEAGDGSRPLAYDGARPISASAFLAEVQALAGGLPAARHVLNLCEDRHRFLIGFCAAMLRGQTTLLPHSRAPEVVDDMLARYPDSYCLIDHDAAPQPPRRHRLPEYLPVGAVGAMPLIDAAACVAIGFTSGSTGAPGANPKTWGSFRASNAHNSALLSRLCALAPDAVGNIVATVPPQHMYGMELSVLLPLLGPFAVHTGRPFFPAEIAAALAEMPAPRLLVTTPVHLRALLQSGQALPPLAGIVSATAPLPAELARQAEARYQAPVQELFGSTETCVIAERRTARGQAWRLYPQVRLRALADGAEVDAPWFAAPVRLADRIERLPGRRFRLCGRSTDLLEIAGKRASLGELTARLLALPGVEDAVVFQADSAGAGGVCRIAALVVAPGRSEAELLAGLRAAVDPVFLPRPLRCVAALPRNATGKLPRAALLDLLQG
jgi:acyl-coenzyme A synthetase/AMP-(fatty) acid ligase